MEEAGPGAAAVVAQHERELTRLSAQRERIEQQLAQPQIHAAADRAPLLQLLAEQVRLRRAIEQAETAWLAASEQLESLLAGEEAAADRPTALR